MVFTFKCDLTEECGGRRKRREIVGERIHLLWGKVGYERKEGRGLEEGTRWLITLIEIGVKHTIEAC